MTAPTNKQGKDFLSFWDVPDGGIEALIRRAEELRGLRAAGNGARDAPGTRAGHGVREGVDADARQLRDRDVRAGRARAVPRDAGLAAGTRRAAARHRARARRLLPRHHAADLRAGAGRGDGALRAHPGDQRPDRSAAPVPAAGGSADGRAAFRRRRRRAHLALGEVRLDRRRQQHGQLVDRGGRHPGPGPGDRVPGGLRARRGRDGARARDRARADHAWFASRRRRSRDAT